MDEARDTGAGGGMLPPIFIGGSGRSGSHALARLIGHHSQYLMLPREIAFHASMDAPNLGDLLDGRTTFETFVEHMRTSWWRREMPWDATVTRGLYKTIDQGVYDSALARFEASYPQDALAASGRLFHDLLDPLAQSEGKRGWVEHTPPSIQAAPALSRALPDARFI